MKRHILAAVLAACSIGAKASDMFTEVAPLYTAEQQASISAALAPSSVTNAIAAFDARTTPMGHPRLFKGQEDFAGIVAAAKAERAIAVQAAAGYLKRNPVANVSSTLTAQINSSDSTTRMSSWWQQARILEGMAEAATVYHFTKDPWFLSEMRARMKLFGPAILSRNCSGDVSETRDYVWFYSLAYDMAYAGLTAEDRKLVHDIILSCGNAGLLKMPDMVRRYPEHAISFNALGKFVGALLIVRGELPAADAWLGQTLQTYMDTLSPWGGPDGGFANGSSYAEWDSGESLLFWDLIDRVLDVPFLKKQWLAEFPRFVAYTLPPGSPAGTFGDGAEVNRAEEWARFGKAIMNRSDTTLSRWYVKQMKGEDYARLHILLSPREYTSSVTLPSTQPNGAYFAAVGTAAMHSSLTDLARTSVYFKSSPFGSVNHSHADQNSFVLYSQGKVLAMDSGYYDYYNSPHWREYYKQTRAHNAITFDGGIGQSLGAGGLGERALNGKLTRFHQSAAYDIASGDATTAYAGLLTQAKRTVVFIRPSTLVTIDQLASNTARKFEYNLHTSVALTGNAASFRADVAPAQLCGVVASPVALTQTTTPGYSPAPTIATTPHYWHRFGFGSAQTKGLIVSVLRTDCSTAQPVINWVGTGATINVAGRQVTVTDTDVTVQ
jgi:hypothetical protein